MCGAPGEPPSHITFPLPQGRFTIAAKHHITIAEIYEAELVDIEKVRMANPAGTAARVLQARLHFPARPEQRRGQHGCQNSSPVRQECVQVTPSLKVAEVSSRNGAPPAGSPHLDQDVM